MTCITKSIDELHATIVALKKDEALLRQIDLASTVVLGALSSGGKVLVAGNGGSAAESIHFAAELTGRFKKDRVALPAIALVADVAAITAIANDYGYERVFERQVMALGDDEDVLFLLSTSGASPNLIAAALAARSKRIKTVALLGKDGGALKDLVDIAIVVPSQSTARIQELHLLIIHAICEHLEHAYAQA